LKLTQNSLDRWLEEGDTVGVIRYFLDGQTTAGWQPS